MDGFNKRVRLTIVLATEAVKIKELLDIAMQYQSRDVELLVRLAPSGLARQGWGVLPIKFYGNQIFNPSFTTTYASTPVIFNKQPLRSLW